jgi:hypothetical protein
MAGRRSRAQDSRGGNRGKGAKRNASRSREPYSWLGAGALTLGVGAALASGSGLAHADDNTTGSAAPQSCNSSPNAPSTPSGPSSGSFAAPDHHRWTPRTDRASPHSAPPHRHR